MEESIYTSFLGTGWSFPPAFERSSGGVELSSDEEDIRESLHILLSTIPGERFMQPRYGCNMDEMVFEPMNATARTYLKNRVRQAILLYEPRINLLELAVDTRFELEGRVEIVIEYQVRTTNSRYNLVFPFYINEANAGPK